MKKIIIIGILGMISFISFAQGGFNPPYEPLDTAEYERFSYCYRGIADGGHYMFNILFDPKAPNNPVYLSLINTDTLSEVFRADFRRNIFIGSFPTFIDDYVPCEKWDEYISKLMNDTIVVANIDTTNELLRDGNRIDSVGNENVVSGINDLINEVKVECNGINKNYYINGTNTIVLNSGTICSFSLLVLNDEVLYSENGISSPFNFQTGFSLSKSNFSKLLNSNITITGRSGASQAIISVIE